MVFIGPKQMFLEVLTAKTAERRYDSRSHLTIGKTKNKTEASVHVRKMPRVSLLQSSMSFLRACSHRRTTLI